MENTTNGEAEAGAESEIPPFTWLRSLGLLYLPSFLQGTGSGMMVPVIPLFAKESLGLTDSEVGLVLALTGVGQVGASIPSGMLHGVIGTRLTMMLGVSLIGISGVVGYKANGMAMLGLCALLRGLGLSLWSLSRQSLIAGWVPVTSRGRAMSMMGGVGRVTNVLGPLIGGIVAARGSYRLVFLVYSCMAACAFLVVAAVIPSTSAKNRAAHKESCCQTATEHRWVLFTAGLYCLSVTLVRNARNLLLPLGAHEQGLSADQVGYVVALSYVTDSALFWTSGVLMDKYGRKFAAVPASFVMAAAMYLLALADGFMQLASIGALFGVGNAMTSGLVMAIGADLAPEASRGEFLGVFRSLTNSGALLGPGLTGLLVGVSLPTASVALGSIALGGGVWCMLMVQETLVIEDDHSGQASQDEIQFEPLPKAAESSVGATDDHEHTDLEDLESDIERDRILASDDSGRHTDTAIMSPTSSIVVS